MLLPSSAAATPPANDNFAHATVLSGDSGTTAGSVTEATAEPSEPAHAGYPAQQSVWYAWTPAVNGRATFDTCTANFDSRLAVYKGDAVAGLRVVYGKAASDSCEAASVGSKLQFYAAAGATYRIAVDGSGGGNFTLAWKRAGAPPTNASPPAVTGTTADGGTLTVTTGQWSGEGTAAYGYQWQRCNATPKDVAIGRVAYASHSLGPENGPDKAIDGSRDAYWNSGGFKPQWLAIDLQAPYPLSRIRAAIAQLPDGDTIHDISVAGPNPGDDFLPLAHLAGFTTDRDPPLEANGPTNQVEYIRIDTTVSPSWVGWQEIEALSRCTDVPGATGPTYLVANADIGSTVRAVVRAANAAGTTAATSSETSVVAAVAPVNIRAPAVSGTAKVSLIVGAEGGSWSGSEPIAYSYSWQRCRRGRCTTIDLETGDTYVVDSADADSRVRVVVTASNAAGTASAASAPTTVVPPICAVPALRRKTLPAAKRTLRIAHCTLGRVRRVYSARMKQGRVISQSPAAGQEYPRGHRVSVVVSRGGRPRHR